MNIHQRHAARRGTAYDPDGYHGPRDVYWPSQRDATNTGLCPALEFNRVHVPQGSQVTMGRLRPPLFISQTTTTRNQ